MTMRIYLTGARGFVGSNIQRVFEAHGAEVLGPGREEVDVTDAGAVGRRVADFGPDAVVHSAILNDFGRLYSHRDEAWAAYVGSTRALADAANAAGAQLVLVSTDWVFDGTQGGADEETPPNPINAYGFLKAASELVVAERAELGAVARLSGVNGVHWARPDAPRRQDAGFGYFVLSIVDALSRRERFTVWDSPAINCVASPVLASAAAELIWRIVERRLGGTFHCCGAEAVGRRELALRTADAFELDAALLDFGPPDPGALPPGPVPHDTSLSGPATERRLDTRLPDLEALLSGLRAEIELERSPA
jgi:dTDP-4-dehydrorhamnose reductase